MKFKVWNSNNIILNYIMSSSLTNYQKVQQFNKSFGMKRHESHQPTLFESDPDLVKLRVDLITEEVSELQEAVNNNDFVEVRDALADILYVVYGMQDAFGINGDSDFDIVHSSNMSKLCSSEDEAIKTVESYEEKFKAGTSPYDSPYYYYLEEQGKWVVKNRSTGKALKSINYTKVDFSK